MDWSERNEAKGYFMLKTVFFFIPTIQIKQNFVDILAELYSILQNLTSNYSLLQQ